MNVPKKFIAGTINDPVEKEIIKGAKLTLTDSRREKRAHKDPPMDLGISGSKGLKKASIP
jgi:hypothetical protein